jgi:hypothetical protein
MKNIERSRSHKVALEKIQSLLPKDLVVEPHAMAHPSFSQGEQNMYTLVSSRSHRLLGFPVFGGSNSFIQLPWFNKDYPNVHIREAGYPMHCSTPICDRTVKCKGAMCCNTVMYDALSNITAWFDRHDVEYVVLDGTLLGGARDKDVIPWTEDLDIGIHAKDVPKLIRQKEIPFHFAYKQETVIPRGCEAHNPGFPGKYSDSTPSLDTLAHGLEAQTGQGSYYIDIYPFETSWEISNEFDSGCLKRNKDGTIRKGTVRIRDRTFNAPVDIEQCLVEWYGKDWRIPKHDNANDVIVKESATMSQMYEHSNDAFVTDSTVKAYRQVHYLA